MGNAPTKEDHHHDGTDHHHHDDEETGAGAAGGVNETTPLIATSDITPEEENNNNRHHNHSHSHHHHHGNEEEEKEEDGHNHHHHEHSHDSHGDSHGDDNQLNEYDKGKITTTTTSSTTAQTKTTDFVLRRLQIATILCCTMTIEIIGGLLAGSLAILSDAAHLAADLASFAVAIIAAHLAARPSTQYHTYGLKRTESLAALFSMTTLALISVGLALEALRRMYSMTWGESEVETVDGRLMSGIATIGVLVNVALAAVLGEHHVHMPGGGHDHSHDHSHDHDHHGDHAHGHSHDHDDHDDNHNKQPPKQQRNVNLQAAYLHVLADLIQSIAVLLAGLIIWYNPQWQIVDPIATIIFCILVFYSTLGVIRASVCVLLEEVPPTISWQSLLDSIMAVPGVCDVHDLHIWSISQGIHAMTVHLRLEYYDHSNNNLMQLQQQQHHHHQHAGKNSNQIIKTIADIAKQNYGIIHSTIQVQHTISPDCDGGIQCICCNYNLVLGNGSSKGSTKGAGQQQQRQSCVLPTKIH